MNDQLNPQVFKQKVMAAHPEYANATASDGTPYASMDATDFTQRFAQKFPDATTSDGHKYADFLPKAPQQAAQPQDQGLWSKIKGRVSDIGGALQDSYTGKINPLTAGLKEAGAVAGGINDTVQAGLELIPGVKQAEGVLGQGISKVAQTAPGQAVLGGIQSFSQAHPEIASDIGNVGNLVGAATTLSGLGAVKGLVGKALGRDALDVIASDIAPQATGKSAASAIAKGGTTKSLLSRTIQPAIDPAYRDAAQIVTDNVPGFKSLKTFSDKINATQEAIGNMAESLKNDVINSGGDRIYSFKELGSKLNGLEKPLLVSSDTTLNNAYDRVIAKALEIAKDNGGKISNLFDARKEFDNFISQQFPNLYSSDTLTPMRVAVKSVRNGINDFIDKNLPAELGFRERLLDQSKLYEAVDNMAPKAVKEVGTTGFERTAARHPIASGLLRGLKKAAIPAALTGLGIEGAHKLFGD